jgi:hypothetical protein
LRCDCATKARVTRIGSDVAHGKGRLADCTLVDSIPAWSSVAQPVFDRVGTELCDKLFS